MTTNDLIVRRTGQVELSDSQFTQEQKQIFENVLNIVDRNTSIDWNKDKLGHNRDFCLIEGNIEPVKEFCLKVQFIAGLSMQAVREVVHGEGTSASCISTVRVWKAGDPRFVELSGASTALECGAKRERKSNIRFFHDMLGRAQTRAFKAALEAYMGFPFINLAIKMVFGTFEATIPEDEGIKSKTTNFGNDISDAEFSIEQEGDEAAEEAAAREEAERAAKKAADKEELERKNIVNQIWVDVKKAHAEGLYSDEEKDRIGGRLKASKTMLDSLLRIKQEISVEIQQRRAKHKK